MSNPSPHSKSDNHAADAATNVIRQKIEHLYKDEPSAKEEIKEAEAATHRSKHQEFMHRLTTSGKSLAEIQTEWHNYYVGLSTKEKHEVWEEFYQAHNQPKKPEVVPQQHTPPQVHHTPHKTAAHHKPKDNRSVAQVKDRIVRTAMKGERAKLKKSQHLRSLVFGMSMGALVMLVLLFSFFNERFIAPFITPSRTVSSTPIIVDPSSRVDPDETNVIIPKVNVEVPVVYGTAYGNDPVQNEKNIQKNLEKGVVHYPTTSKPGEFGNAAIFGHSSNNLFNPGQYKFAFVLLNVLEEGDTFYITRKGTRYVYRVYQKKIVAPDQVEILDKQSKAATATLVTCDPPGSSLRRLVIVGEQISPSPGKNSKSSAKKDIQAKSVPGNAPSLWSRLTGWLFD